MLEPKAEGPIRPAATPAWSKPRRLWSRAARTWKVETPTGGSVGRNRSWRLTEPGSAPRGVEHRRKPDGFRPATGGHNPWPVWATALRQGPCPVPGPPRRQRRRREVGQTPGALDEEAARHPPTGGRRDRSESERTPVDPRWHPSGLAPRSGPAKAGKLLGVTVFFGLLLGPVRVAFPTWARVLRCQRTWRGSHATGAAEAFGATPDRPQRRAPTRPGRSSRMVPHATPRHREET